MLWSGVCLAIAVVGGCREQRKTPADPPFTTRIPPACHVDALGACRVGCDADPPAKVVDVKPDLSGIELTGLRGVALAEILIDTRGEVRGVCLLRGVREDVDERAVAAIRQWQFEPTRLRHSTPPGMLVPVVMTVSLAINQ
jgi:TonB family protein